MTKGLPHDGLRCVKEGAYSRRRQSAKRVTHRSIEAAIVCFFIFSGGYCAQASRFFEASIGKYSVAGKTAETDEERAKGLGGVESLDPLEGMLFLFEKKHKYNFWMKNMKIPIDIIWVNDNEIVDITRNIPLGKPGESLRMYKPSSEVDRVIEINAGTADKLNVRIGQKVSIAISRYSPDEIRAPVGTFVEREYLNGICKRVIKLNRILIKTDKKEKIITLIGIKPVPSLPGYDAENRGTDYLANMIEGRKVVAEVDLAQHDDGGRNLGLVISTASAGRFINYELIKRGYAMADRSVPHANMKAYIDAEFEAKKECIGLWTYVGCGE